MEDYSYIAEIEPGVWIANGFGDPPRTLIKDNARRFTDKRLASMAIRRARKFKPFPAAKAIKTNMAPHDAERTYISRAEGVGLMG